MLKTGALYFPGRASTYGDVFVTRHPTTNAVWFFWTDGPMFSLQQDALAAISEAFLDPTPEPKVGFKEPEFQSASPKVDK